MCVPPSKLRSVVFSYTFDGYYSHIKEWWAMNSRSRVSATKPSTHIATSLQDRCDCLPFPSLHTTLHNDMLAEREDEQQYVPITEPLYQSLCTHLDGYFPSLA